MWFGFAKFDGISHKRILLKAYSYVSVLIISVLTLEETRGSTDYAFQKLRYELSDTLNRPDLKTSRRK